jgi:type VI secretion system protein ImpM
MTMSQTSLIGWYGKLPGAGDFVQRGLPESVVNAWAHWFQLGLVYWQQTNSLQPRRMLEAPVWNFIVPPTLGSQMIQMGCISPAHDRVGREYPLCAMRLIDPQQWNNRQLDVAAEWYQQLARLLVTAVRRSFTQQQFDEALQGLVPLPVAPLARANDIMQVLGDDTGSTSQGGTLPWAQVAQCFEPSQYTSYWWSSQLEGQPLYTHVHSGNFTGQLFSLLFNPAGGVTPGRHGLYPPMFD